MIRKGEKIIHVHFLVSHKNYYFGSVTAMFKMFTEKDIAWNILDILLQRMAIICCRTKH